ncbi:MAG: ATP-dependent Clp protease adapter ClpS [SAR324 cluster bacterium]|nr:ATP-dependent Clp protease adapter ClpS [SAR324 cluster bacterium]
MSELKTADEVVTRTKKKLKPPNQYKVLLHNDDYTTMEFVVYILQFVFHKSPSEATQIMLRVHENGTGICGVYSYEIAETKVAAVHDLAEQYEFPLKSSMEEA